MDTHFLEYLVKARQLDLEKDFMHIHLARAFPGSIQAKFQKTRNCIGANFFPSRYRKRDQLNSVSEAKASGLKQCSNNQECCPCCMN